MLILSEYGKKARIMKPYPTVESNKWGIKCKGKSTKKIKQGVMLESRKEETGEGAPGQQECRQYYIRWSKPKERGNT